MLQNLPAELLDAVLGDLGYLDAIRLSQVNRHLNCSINPQAWPIEDKEQEIYDAQRWDKHNLVVFNISSGGRVQEMVQKSDGYACFSCYKVKDKSGFSRNQTERYKGKEHFRNRFCIECGVRDGKYRPGTTLNIVKDRVWSASRHHFTLQRESITSLLVCEHCNNACEFEVVGPPEIYGSCEEVQTEIDKSEQGKRALETRKHGYIIVECQGCHGANNIPVGQEPLQCEECDDYICKKCFGLTSDHCACEGHEDPILSLNRLFSVGKEADAKAEGLLGEDDLGIDKLFSLDI